MAGILFLSGELRIESGESKLKEMKKYLILIISFFLMTLNSCQSQTHIKEGDDCFNKGDYVCAKQNYSAQKSLGSADEMDKKIEQCDACMNISALAGFYFANNDFLKAKEQYEELLKINIKDPHAKKQLELCNKQLETNVPDFEINDAAQQNAKGVSFFREKNYTEAVEWYRKSAEQGDAGGQANLGYMYRNGYGVTKDDAEAVKWYRKSAEQGNVVGQRNLGVVYENGYGVTKDYDEALKWYRKAVEQGDADAQIGLGNMYFNGYGVEANLDEAVSLFLKAAEQGHIMGQYNLGLMYESGFGVPRDRFEAIKWYTKASEQGHPSAKKAIERLSDN